MPKKSPEKTPTKSLHPWPMENFLGSALVIVIFLLIMFVLVTMSPKEDTPSQTPSVSGKQYRQTIAD